MTGPDLLVTMSSHYEPWLVVLSIVVAASASYAALDFAGRLADAAPGSRHVWLFGGATAMGIGVWAMHFIGMLAFRLPVPVSYDVPLVVFSMVAAILASVVALHVAARPSVGLPALLGGGLVMGSGIGVMHYSGMFAMRVDARILYDPSLFLLSVAIAVTVSVVAMWLAFILKGQSGTMGVLQRLVSAIVMGASIAGLHYTAMAAAHFVPTATTGATGASYAAPTGLAIGIGVATAAVLGLALLGPLLADREEEADARLEGGAR